MFIVPVSHVTVVADAIRNDPDSWSEAILGCVFPPHPPPPTHTPLRYIPRRPRKSYISTILSPNTWGGAIELSILAAHYGTEIASVDVETGRVDRFSPPPGRTTTGNRVLLVYSGIHYDAAVLAPELGAPAEWCASIVSIVADGDADPMIIAIKKLADKLRAKKAYTNMATFALKCEVRARWSRLRVHFFDWFRFWLDMWQGPSWRERGPRTCRRDRPCRIWGVLAIPMRIHNCSSSPFQLYPYFNLRRLYVKNIVVRCQRILVLRRGQQILI